MPKLKQLRGGCCGCCKMICAGCHLPCETISFTYINSQTGIRQTALYYDKANKSWSSDCIPYGSGRIKVDFTCSENADPVLRFRQWSTSNCDGTPVVDCSTHPLTLALCSTGNFSRYWTPGCGLGAYGWTSFRVFADQCSESGGKCCCSACVRIIDPCASNAPVVGASVKVYQFGTTTLVKSGTTNAIGLLCDIPQGIYNLTIEKAGYETIRKEEVTIYCNETLTYNQRSLGRVQCYGMTCNATVGRVPTTFTFTKSGQPTVTGTTGSSGYVDLYLTATGVWAWTATADKFVAQSGNYNYASTCGTYDYSVTSTPISTHFCGCSKFANAPSPFAKIATITDCGGSTSLDVSGNANYCGGTTCVDRPLDNTTSAPTMPTTYCWDSVNLREVNCGTLPYDDTGTKNVKIGLSIFASESATPSGILRSPQITKTWNDNCVEDTGETLPNCTPENMLSQTWRDGRWTCEDITVGGVIWYHTGYTIHSHDPPVVEVFFGPSPDFGPVAGTTPPPGGPPCPSIILSVDP